MDKQDKSTVESYPKVTRVEVIDTHGGRKYVEWDLEDVWLSLQDDGRTLKIFVTSEDDQ